MNFSQTLSDALPWPEPLYRDVRRFLVHRLNCPETAADLVQETFLRLHKISLSHIPDNPRALAFRIAANLAVDHQRKLMIRDRYHCEVDEEILKETVPCEDPGPERTLMEEQRFEQLHKALGELPEECRMVFLLHSVEELSYSEIAARLGLSKSTVGKYLAKAIQYCAERVAQSHTPPAG